MLRPRALIVLLSLTLAACGESPLEPPSGLPAQLSVSILRDLPIEPPIPTVAASADSVVVEYISGFTGCDDYDAAAGFRAGTLVVTVIATETRRACLAVVGYATYHAVVHRAPSGRYPVVVETQYVAANGIRGKPREVVRKLVTLP
ncbi:MAG TPA: hypothetical protein VF761_14040 [Gemmatimonadaceae bacterium]